MSPSPRLALTAAVIALTVLTSGTPAQASPHPSTAAMSARVRLWDDADGDGVLGSEGDVLRSHATATSGTFTLAATGCQRCGVVIDQVQGSETAATPRVSISLDGAATSTIGGLLWRDADQDGALGGDADILVGIANAGDGPLTSPAPLCGTCGLVVVDWVGSGQDIDWVGSGQDIDTISGTVVDWGGSSQDIDWGGSGDDVDWGGSGDDIDMAAARAR